MDFADNILGQQHFLAGNPMTVLDRRWNEWEFVHCYHGTRVPKVSQILSNGLFPPTEDHFVLLLESLGIKDIDFAELRNVIETNGSKIYVQLGSFYAWNHNDFYKEGPEKLRKYLYRKYGVEGKRYLAEIQRWEPAIVELIVPIELFDGSPIWDDIEEEGSNMLHDSLDEIDLTMETGYPIPADYIVRVHNPNDSHGLNR